MVENGENVIRVSAELMAKFRSEQNLLVGTIGALGVGLAGAVLWAVIGISTGYQIGYIAVAIGFGVGFAMRFFGKGLDQVFGIVGAIIAVLSVYLGNIFTLVGFVAEEYQTTVFDVLEAVPFIEMNQLMFVEFGFIDIVFYAIALIEGYKFAFRQITEEDLVEDKKINPL